MEVLNCRTCGRLFNYLSGAQSCPQCKKALEEKYLIIKEYLRDNPGATVRELIDEFGVSRRQIEVWVREEKLMFSSEEGSEIGCQRCGKPIRTGMYCKKCKDRVAETLNTLYMEQKQEEIKKKGPSSDGKMRYL